MPSIAAATTSHELALHAGGFRLIAGVDEAGRGALAGPVVAAAVIFPAGAGLPCVADSKTLTAARREALDAEIRACATAFAVGVIGVPDIESVNILRATHLAMRAALIALDPPPDFALVDGLPVPGLPVASRSIVDGDQHCASIAAASIIAKVHRDRIMRDLDAIHPGYGFAGHKGYGTSAHHQALQRLGPCPAHRMTFAPLRALTQSRLDLT